MNTTERKIADRLAELRTTRDDLYAGELLAELETLKADQADIDSALRQRLALIGDRSKPTTRYGRLEALMIALDAVADNLDGARSAIKESDTAELNALANLNDQVAEFQAHLEDQLEELA